MTLTSVAADVDVAVIGAGVVGAAAARRLARTSLRVALVEAGADVGAGTSKANTAILHTGFDAKPGSVEAALVPQGAALLRDYADRSGIAVERTGALLVAWTEEELARLPEIAAQAAANGYVACEELDVAGCHEREPELGPGALGGLLVPDESIVCPWSPPIAYATEAVVNGATLLRRWPVEAIEDRGDRYALSGPGGSVLATWVVNAAGLRSDEVEAMLGHHHFTVTPRRGELLVFDKQARALVRSIVLPVPTGRTKGVLVSPTVFGNVVLGPTAVDGDDKDDTGFSREAVDTLLAHGRRIVPRLFEEEVTAMYVGLRAATEHTDYQLAVRPQERTACLGGIRSTGLTSALALAEWLAGELAAAGVDVTERDDAGGVRLTSLGEQGPRPYQDAALIGRDPEYGRIVCHCERVTAGEVREALTGPVPAVDLDGVRRRTRALMGRCQGFACLAEIVTRTAEGSGRAPADLLGIGAGASSR